MGAKLRQGDCISLLGKGPDSIGIVGEVSQEKLYSRRNAVGRGHHVGVRDEGTPAEDLHAPGVPQGDGHSPGVVAGTRLVAPHDAPQSGGAARWKGRKTLAILRKLKQKT